MRPLGIAALQMSPVLRDVEATLAVFERRVWTIRQSLDSVQLIVLPELHLAAVGGFFDDELADVRKLAETVPGRVSERLGALAQATGLWLVPGSIYERADKDGEVYNTALAISPDGELVTSYRKCFPWQPYERTVPGTRFVTFDIPHVGRLGLAICHDGAFPEVFRALAWMGAEVVIQPTLTTTVDRDAELVLARANAIANQIYVVSVNAPAPTGLGRSAIVDPEGLVRVQAGDGEELLTDVLDLDAVTRVRKFGSFGINRLLAQFQEHAPHLELPLYGGYRPPDLSAPDRETH